MAGSEDVVDDIGKVAEGMGFRSKPSIRWVPHDLNEILQVINSQTNKLSNINGRVDKNGTAIIKFTIAIQNLKELEQIVDKVKSVPDVYSVKRITT